MDHHLDDFGLPVHRYLSRQLDLHPELTNAEVARRLGYERPNVIAMMRTGSMKIPVNKVPALAEMLGLEPQALLRRVLMEYDREFWETLQVVFGAGTLTSNESALIDLLRQHAGSLDPDLAGDAIFATGFTLLVGQVVDEHILAELADRKTPAGRRVTAAMAANDELEALTKRQALERIALRRQLLTNSPPRRRDAS